jgi:hypothetical protein
LFDEFDIAVCAAVMGGEMLGGRPADADARRPQRGCHPGNWLQPGCHRRNKRSADVALLYSSDAA